MRRFAAVLVALVGGCFNTDLDPTKTGVFACDDEAEIACPDGQACVNGRCEADDTVPTVQINNPEDEEDVQLEGIEIGVRRTITIRMSGTLDLVPEGGDDVFGEGHLEVTVDDEAPVVVDSGALSGGVRVDVELDNTIGPHRIAVAAIRNDGTPYDHQGAAATRLFWISDGVVPLVGIKRPWPNTEFPLDATPLEVEAAVLRFTLQTAVQDGGTQPRTGHVHIYYDKDIEECILDTLGCDKDYLTTVVELGTPGQLTLPDASAASFPISVVLRNIDHTLYDGDGDPDDMIVTPVIDEILVVRR